MSPTRVLRTEQTPVKARDQTLTSIKEFESKLGAATPSGPPSVNVNTRVFSRKDVLNEMTSPFYQTQMSSFHRTTFDRKYKNDIIGSDQALSAL